MSASDISNIQISNDVISAIASVAAMEIDGVYGLTASISSNLKDIIYKKGSTKGVSVDVDENNNVTIVVNIIVKYNFKIQDVALAVQTEVKRAVSDMTNLEVAAVNVNVVSVSIPTAENK